MRRFMSDPWNGINPAAHAQLSQRDYQQGDLAAQIGTSGVEARELLAAARASLAAAWIPGVEIFPRAVHQQRHRGSFGELARAEDGIAAAIGLWPRQWAAARMFAGTAKGFHIHPPSIPAGTAPADWFRRLFVDEPQNHALRPYGHEQWDMMFILQGNVEFWLVDERPGLPRRVMRVLVEGDDQRGPNNAGLIIPAGVAHALRAEGGRDVMMVYGTSTSFHAEFEGRIASGVESAPPPDEWVKYLAS
jgi:dTDP-4-dehydrorhamnose 3,5-epimerase-like enzyme